MRSLAHFTLISLAFASACSSGGHFVPYADPARSAAENWPQVITNLDVLRIGQAQAESFVEALPVAERAEAKAAIERASRATVCIEVRTRTRGSSYQAQKGSGVVMLGETAASPVRVGTAGHVLEGGSTEVRILGSSGEVIAFDTARQQHVQFGTSDQDWGTIELASPPRETPALVVALPQASEIAFVLAYPDGAGRDVAGRMVYSRAVDAVPLQPVLTIGEVTRVAPLQLRPLAGAIPLGGASGGAIVNRRGELIGLFNSVVSSLTWWLNGASTAALKREAPR
jgi:hypothetical protein